jgi:enamine deaminase RidA (YjgF/YER057c/UK114 family)
VEQDANVSFDERVSALGLQLPGAPQLPPHISIPFEWVRIVGNRCVVSGHGALTPGGAPMGPFGKVPTEVSLEEAQSSALSAGLSMLAAIRRAVGTLDRASQWVIVNGFVNAEPGYDQTTAVLNPVSDLLIEVFGDSGRHARTAIGVVALPMNLPVIVSAELLLET